MTFPISPEAPVLIIGAANIDVIGVLDDNLHTSTSNPANIRFSFGGVARNVAENLSRLGHPVKLITAVGDDQFGAQLLNQITDAGVDAEDVICSSQFSTGSYIGVIDRAGELQLALDDMHIIREYLHNILGIDTHCLSRHLSCS